MTERDAAKAPALGPAPSLLRRAGLSPGMAVFVGERKRDAVSIHIIDYAPDRCDEIAAATVDDCTRAHDRGSVTWINVDGVHDVEQLSALGFTLGLHKLTIEDLVNTTQRPKAEDYPTYIFLALESFGDHIDELDDAILGNPQPDHIREIHRLKREAIRLRRAAWPLREEIIWLERCESPLISRDAHVYLRDLYDHTMQVVDMIEGYRDILGTLHDTYLSSVSNRLNEIMKILTMIATVFIPLTFVVGVYGMNFAHMPELAWRWGYLVMWTVMIAIAAGMMVQFKRRGWW